jgi:hypothetical protein
LKRFLLLFDVPLRSCLKSETPKGVLSLGVWRALRILIRFWMGNGYWLCGFYRAGEWGTKRDPDFVIVDARFSIGRERRGEQMEELSKGRRQAF